MLMTEAENKYSNTSTHELLERKRQLESGLAAASMHGVEAPEDLVSELKETQIELASRSTNETKN
jgi:hypothetical protein